jgi:hypothetical protein
MKDLWSLLGKLVVDLPRAGQKGLSTLGGGVEVVERHDLAVVGVEGLTTR